MNAVICALPAHDRLSRPVQLNRGPDEVLGQHWRVALHVEDMVPLDPALHLFQTSTEVGHPLLERSPVHHQLADFAHQRVDFLPSTASLAKCDFPDSSLEAFVGLLSARFTGTNCGSSANSEFEARQIKSSE